MACLVLPQAKTFKVVLNGVDAQLATLLMSLVQSRAATVASLLKHRCITQEFQRGSFAGDDKFSVDRLVQSCKHKAVPALSSAGRELVPYFSSPGECIDDTLSQTKPDAARSAFVAIIASTCTHPVHDPPSTRLLCICTGKGKSHPRSLAHPAQAPQGHQ